MDRGLSPLRISHNTQSVSNEMSLKLERGRVTFENAIITNTRTTNCFLILFPKQFLPK